MTEMFGEAWPPMSVPDLAPADDDDYQWLVLQSVFLRSTMIRSLFDRLKDFLSTCD